MKKIIYNGKIVLPDKILEGYDIVVEDEFITELTAGEENIRKKYQQEQAEFYDAAGGYVMAGFIDTHSDYIEGLVQPRPTSIMDFQVSLCEAEKHLLSHGITMMYHSLSLVKEDEKVERKSIRKKQNVERLVNILKGYEEEAHLIKHRFHARYEIDNLEIYDYLKELMERGFVQELSFMDHTPGQGQYRDIEQYAETFRAWRNLEDDTEFEKFLEESKKKPLATREQLMKLAELAKELQIPLASHDDDTEGKILLNKEEFGIKISEFPITIEVAKKAKECGMMVVVGAPNILLNGSHAGNLNAEDAVKEGCADILCSDYYPAALLHAIFLLEERGACTLPEAVRMVNLNPAKALGIDKEYGQIAPGKRADLIIVHKENQLPVLTKCFIDGNVVLQFEYQKSKAV